MNRWQTDLFASGSTSGRGNGRRKNGNFLCVIMTYRNTCLDPPEAPGGRSERQKKRLKSIIAGYGQSVKNNIIEHMQNVINYGIPNAETLAAIREVEELEKDPNKKVYNSFDELLEELDNE